MSLKAFHVVFITASILLAFGFGAWSYFDYKDQGKTADLIYAIGSSILSLLAVVVLVLGGLAAFFIYLARRAAMTAAAETPVPETLPETSEQIHR